MSDVTLNDALLMEIGDLKRQTLLLKLEREQLRQRLTDRDERIIKLKSELNGDDPDEDAEGKRKLAERRSR